MSETRSDVRVEIVPYEPSHRAAFQRLNEAWISRYFRIEPPDTRVLEAPQEQILDKGGDIIVAASAGDVVGVCALLRVDGDTFELAKMAVAESARGHGVGFLVGQEAIGRARAAGASRLILESNTVLTPAIALYRKLGFVEVTGVHSEYARCNIHMALQLQSRT
jgi:GNAT superfamily N-acetyltransferase